MADSVKIVHAALDESPGGEILLRGVIDPASLHLLKVGPYQREILPLATINGLVKAFKEGSVPDVDLGMRGERFTTRPGDGGDNFYLQDDTFIVDGLQRVTAAQLLSNQGGVPHLGATIHFSTTEEWERERFRILNAHRTKLSPNVLLRNRRHDYAVVEMLFRLTSDSGFVLGNRVSWAQRMQRDHLLTALTFAKVIGRLHGHLGPTGSTTVDDLARGLEVVMERIGKNVMRDNVRAFFDFVDTAWGIKRVAFKEGATYMRATFLWTLARLLSDHTDFWRDNRLVVVADLQRKIANFPVADPQVSNLSSAGGKARDILYVLLVNHVNSGRRTRKLKPRADVYPDVRTEDEVGDEEI